jgi:hypothetical protein
MKLLSAKQRCPLHCLVSGLGNSFCTATCPPEVFLFASFSRESKTQEKRNALSGSRSKDSTGTQKEALHAGSITHLAHFRSFFVLGIDLTLLDFFPRNCLRYGLLITCSYLISL